MRFGFNARFAQDRKRLVDGRTTPVGVLAGSRIVDERNTAHREYLLGIMQLVCPRWPGNANGNYLLIFASFGRPGSMREELFRQRPGRTKE